MSEAQPQIASSTQSNWWWRDVCWLLGGIVFLLWGLLGWLPVRLDALFTPLIAVDANQHRLDTALPAPTGDFTIEQTFVPDHDGLREIELLLVRWDETQNGRFWLKLRDDKGNTVAEEWINSLGVAHNQGHVFRFPVQANSAGRPYTLELGGSATNPLSAWGYSLDVIGNGRLQLVPTQVAALVPETAVQDIRFTTRYQLTVAGAFAYTRPTTAPTRRVSAAGARLYPLARCAAALLHAPPLGCGCLVGNRLCLRSRYLALHLVCFDFGGGALARLVTLALVCRWLARLDYAPLSPPPFPRFVYQSAYRPALDFAAWFWRAPAGRARHQHSPLG
ncbi:MAG: hypothetical protein H6660_12185 [Ardenticatenaceae bacterium]|nr:hypothetical protein [Ardenticatenaceae bacterium]